MLITRAKIAHLILYLIFTLLKCFGGNDVAHSKLIKVTNIQVCQINLYLRKSIEEDDETLSEILKRSQMKFEKV